MNYMDIGVKKLERYINIDDYYYSITVHINDKEYEIDLLNEVLL